MLVLLIHVIVVSDFARVFFLLFVGEKLERFLHKKVSIHVRSFLDRCSLFHCIYICHCGNS